MEIVGDAPGFDRDIGEEIEIFEGHRLALASRMISRNEFSASSTASGSRRRAAASISWSVASIVRPRAARA